MKPLMECFEALLAAHSNLNMLHLAEDVLSALMMCCNVEGANTLTFSRLAWICSEGTSAPAWLLINFKLEWNVSRQSTRCERVAKSEYGQHEGSNPSLLRVCSNYMATFLCSGAVDSEIWEGNHTRTSPLP